MSGKHPIEHLYLEHHGWLQGWLRHRLNNTADAADRLANSHRESRPLLKKPEAFKQVTGPLPESADQIIMRSIPI
ncbi:RNA polymerase sigma factor [compost metagenome]